MVPPALLFPGWKSRNGTCGLEKAEYTWPPSWQIYVKKAGAGFVRYPEGICKW